MYLFNRGNLETQNLSRKFKISRLHVLKIFVYMFFYKKEILCTGNGNIFCWFFFSFFYLLFEWYLEIVIIYIIQTNPLTKSILLCKELKKYRNIFFFFFFETWNKCYCCNYTSKLQSCFGLKTTCYVTCYSSESIWKSRQCFLFGGIDPTNVTNSKNF